ncbi:MAG: hypothetical protein KGL42_13610 [Betaproteobacteria bacterium]|nr:hypothetical protein [Betaproteobacteria bacterium]
MKRNADLFEELQRTTADFQRVIGEHDQVKAQTEALAKQREHLRRRIAELNEQVNGQPSVEMLQQLSTVVVAHAKEHSQAFFTCLVCKEHFPCGVSERMVAELQQTGEAASLGSVVGSPADIARWLGSWQMRYPCGHSLCRLCYDRSLRALLMPEWGHHSTALSSVCPLCKSPRYVLTLDDDLKEWEPDDVFVEQDSALHVTLCAGTDDEDDDYAYLAEDDHDDTEPSSAASSDSSSSSEEKPAEQVVAVSHTA